MTDGIATNRPAAVATSASEMPFITTLGPVVAAHGEVVERPDDAEHGAEEADERRVVAQRAEDHQVALQHQFLVHALARHYLLDREVPLPVVLEARQRDLGLDAGRELREVHGVLDVAGVQFRRGVSRRNR